MTAGSPPAKPTRAPAGPAQLALQFPLSPRYRFDNFVLGANAELVLRLEQLVEQGPGFGGCFVFGARGVGRTHLLQAACHLQGSRAGSRSSAIYLPLADPMVTPELLDGLDRLELVALDDVEAWLGDARREGALLALYQGLLSAGGRLLVSAGIAAGQLQCRYPDLASRLRGLPAYQLRALDDAGKARVLERLARERGLQLTEPVLDFWLARSARDLSELLLQFERLDVAAMAAQRRVTVPLVKQVLGL
ncbi:MAG: DnaA regulatory inactivator Hda [Pseudomonadales bacterium]